MRSEEALEKEARAKEKVTFEEAEEIVRDNEEAKPDCRDFRRI